MQIARRRGMKKAIVALARRLAVIMHRIWVDGTEFRWTPGPSDLADSPHPSSREGHHSTVAWSSSFLLLGLIWRGRTCSMKAVTANGNARLPERLFHLVLGSHDGRALVPIPKRSASP